MKGASLVPAAVRYVEQVARSGSIQRAARELNIAASAIDRQILNLEESLGVKLFERVPRGMRVTDAGSTTVALSRQWRSGERLAASHLQQLQGLIQEQVRLTAMDSHVNGVLPDLLKQLAASHPRISLGVEIATTDAASLSLVNGSADIAVAFNLQPRRDLHVLWSSELPFGCVVAPDHPLSRRQTTSLQEVAKYPLALQDRSLAIRRFLEARNAWLFTDQHLAVETNSLQLIKILARTGRYAVFTSELDAAPEIISGQLIFVPVRDPGAEPQTISVVIEARRPLPRVANIVVELLVERIKLQLDQVRECRRSMQQE